MVFDDEAITFCDWWWWLFLLCVSIRYSWCATSNAIILKLSNQRLQPINFIETVLLLCNNLILPIVFIELKRLNYRDLFPSLKMYAESRVCSFVRWHAAKFIKIILNWYFRNLCVFCKIKKNTAINICTPLKLNYRFRNSISHSKLNVTQSKS